MSAAEHRPLPLYLHPAPPHMECTCGEVFEGVDADTVREMHKEHRVRAGMASRESARAHLARARDMLADTIGDPA